MELKEKSLSDGFTESQINGEECKEDGSQLHKNVHLSVEYVDPDTVCGIGKFKPQWLQKYATSGNYLILYCLAGVIQGAYYAYLIATLSTLERRYAFKSKISGVIMTIDEFTPLFLGMLIGYFGGRMHRPRLLAAGMYMSVFCCFLSALPYYMYGPSEQLMDSSVKNESSTEFCDFSQKHENCDEDDRPPTITAVVLLCIGSLCKGFGSISYLVIGLPYMDDNAKKKNSPLYLAFIECMRLFGPILGFLMSSGCLKLYEDPLSDPGYGPEDPRWIGAWWLGFTIQGIVLAIISFPLFLFPRRLPKTKPRSLSTAQNSKRESNAPILMGLVIAVKSLCKNPLYITFTIATILSVISRFGFFVMLPKYMEHQFRLSSSSASLLSGPIGLFGAQVTGMIGGYVVYKWRPSAKKLIAGHAIIELIWSIGLFCLVIPSCQHYEMINKGMTENGLDISNQCNSECMCSTRFFTPVCGPDGKSNYFSPCHAGCKDGRGSSDTLMRNCSCIYSNKLQIMEKDAIVSKGLCEDDECWGQALTYIIMFPILCSLANLLCVSQMMVQMRCMDPKDKGITLGIFESLVSALGFIPHPMIYGSLADSACLIWESSCGKTGNCWYYDIDKFKYLMHGAAGFFGLAATIAYAILYPMSNRLQKLYDDDDDIIPCDQKDAKKLHVDSHVK